VCWIASTHYHADHCADLVAILFGFEVPSAPAPSSVELVGPPGHAEFQFLQRLEGVFPGLPPKRIPRHVTEIGLDGEPLHLGAFVLSARQAVHKQPAVSYRVEASGASLVYSGDTDRSDTLVDLCRGADVAVLDCSMPDDRKVPGHMTPTECAEVAAAAGVRTLVLSHLYPECDGVDVEACARRTFAGDVRVAHDGMRLAI
jgi:ribonuclease BN (tRNA processing enzyme)